MGRSGPLGRDGKPVSQEPKISFLKRKDANFFHALPAIPEELEMSEVGLSGAQKAMELLSFALGSDEESSDGEIAMSPLHGNPEADIQKLLHPEAQGPPKTFMVSDVESQGKGIVQLQCARTSSGSFKATGQEPILNLGTVSKRSKPGHLMKIFVFLFFISINVSILTGILALAYCAGNLTEAVIVTVVSGLTWLALFMFNIWVASQPEMVIHRYWETKRSRLLPLREGKVVILVGKVSQVDQTVTSDFRKDGEFLVVDTSLKSIIARHEDYCLYKDHVKQTKASDFKVTDIKTGVTIMVEASVAARDGLLKSHLVPMVSIPLKVSADVAPLLKRKDKRRKAMENTQYKVHEGYVVDGQTVTIMGRLKRAGPKGDLVLGPIQRIHNISWFLLFHGFLPFFCPVWVSGLVIMD